MAVACPPTWSPGVRQRGVPCPPTGRFPCPSSRELVERARTGDLDAFSSLVKASHPRLHKVANLILRTVDDSNGSCPDGAAE